MATKEAFSFCIELKRGSQPSANGTLKCSWCRSSDKYKASGWRAYIVYECGERKFGSIKQTPRATMEMLCNNLPLKSGQFDLAMTALAAHDFEEPDSEPAPRVKNGATPPPQTFKLTSTPEPVRCVHQIYGVYKDGKPMSDLFQESMRRWKAWAVTNGAVYHLWKPDELDTLVKDHYPDFWRVYKEVRYPVQRVDIGRLCILHSYGGLYSDLDVWPNRADLPQVMLGLQRIPEGLAANHHAHWDMEVIIAAEKNPDLLAWLNFMKNKINEKGVAYRNPDSFHHNARMRFIYHTTGPTLLNAFIKSKLRDAEVFPIQSNRAGTYDDLTKSELKRFDVLTRTSNTYYTNELEISVPVCEESVQLPDRLKRTCVKRKRTKEPGLQRDFLETAEKVMAPQQPDSAEPGSNEKALAEQLGMQNMLSPEGEDTLPAKKHKITCQCKHCEQDFDLDEVTTCPTCVALLQKDSLDLPSLQKLVEVADTDSAKARTDLQTSTWQNAQLIEMNAKLRKVAEDRDAEIQNLKDAQCTPQETTFIFQKQCADIQKLKDANEQADTEIKKLKDAKEQADAEIKKLKYLNDLADSEIKKLNDTNNEWVTGYAPKLQEVMDKNKELRADLDFDSAGAELFADLLLALNELKNTAAMQTIMPELPEDLQRAVKTVKKHASGATTWDDIRTNGKIGGTRDSGASKRPAGSQPNYSNFQHGVPLSAVE